MIYFIRAEGMNLVKIGYVATRDGMGVRLIQLRCGSPVPLSVVGVMDGDLDAEAGLHRRFAHSRTHGEWFRLTQEMVDFIGENVRPYVPWVRVTAPSDVAGCDGDDSADVIREFLADQTEPGRCAASRLYKAFCAYWQDRFGTGRTAPSTQAFSQALVDGGVGKVKSSGVIMYSVGLRDAQDSANEGDQEPDQEPEVIKFPGSCLGS